MTDPNLASEEALGEECSKSQHDSSFCYEHKTQEYDAYWQSVPMQEVADSSSFGPQIKTKFKGEEEMSVGDDKINDVMEAANEL